MNPSYDKWLEIFKSQGHKSALAMLFTDISNSAKRAWQLSTLCYSIQEKLKASLDTENTDHWEALQLFELANDLLAELGEKMDESEAIAKAGLDAARGKKESSPSTASPLPMPNGNNLPNN